MARRTLTSLTLAAGCAIALAIPAAQAQTTDTQILTNTPRLNAGDRADWMAARNNAESAQYERLLENSPAFRQARMRKECGPITDAQLHQSCLASFAQDESRGDNPVEGAPNTSADRMSGGSTGTMTTTGANPAQAPGAMPDYSAPSVGGAPSGGGSGAGGMR